MSHSARASAALRALTEADPALAALSLWCSHRDVEVGPTAETQGDVILYGPGFATLPLHEQIGLAGHHILHVALRHGARLAAMAERWGESFDPQLWQIAADAIVNEALLQAGHALPRPALTLTGLLRAAFASLSPADEALAEWDADRLYLRLLASPGAGAARAKSHAADQDFRPDLQPHPAEGVNAAAEADWRAHLARAMSAGRAAGLGLGVMGHRLADMPQSRTPWEVVLRRALLRATLPLPELSHRRPARTWLAMQDEALRRAGPEPVFQPGLSRARPAPRIVIGLDCSTSVAEAQMEMLMGEVAGIARRTLAEVHLLTFDTDVRQAVMLTPFDWQARLATLDLPQGGGTDFAPLVARTVRLQASVLVVLTDLDGPAGPAPRLPVLWAVPNIDPPPPAPFGQALSLSH